MIETNRASPSARLSMHPHRTLPLASDGGRFAYGRVAAPHRNAPIRYRYRNATQTAAAPLPVRHIKTVTSARFPYLLSQSRSSFLRGVSKLLFIFKFYLICFSLARSLARSIVSVSRNREISSSRRFASIGSKSWFRFVEKLKDFLGVFSASGLFLVS